MQSTPKGPSYLLMFTNMMCCFTQQMMLFNSKCSTAQHTLPGNTFFFFSPCLLLSATSLQPSSFISRTSNLKIYTISWPTSVG